jgi:uncharacterized DUF497 family protein
MLYEWDETKRRKNIAMHDVDFSAVESFEWESAVIRQDVCHKFWFVVLPPSRLALRSWSTRKDYGETRYAALGPIEGRLHCVCFTIRGNKLRIISLRKANEREVKIWLEK